jgi:hypothetical protein
MDIVRRVKPIAAMPASRDVPRYRLAGGSCEAQSYGLLHEYLKKTLNIVFLVLVLYFTPFMLAALDIRVFKNGSTAKSSAVGGSCFSRFV